MALKRSLGLLLTQTMLDAITTKIKEYEVNEPTICAEYGQVEDIVALMLTIKDADRYAWVGETREGEGILLFLADESTIVNLTKPGSTTHYGLCEGSTRHVVPYMYLSNAAEVILKYLVEGKRP